MNMKTLIKQLYDNVNNYKMKKFVCHIKAESDSEHVSGFVFDDSQ